MANSKARCTNCRGFYPQPSFFYSNSLQRLCSERCFNEWRDRSHQLSPTQLKAKRAMKRTAPPKIPIALRMEVRARDHNQCRWCGGPGFECHHVHYRSEGGPNEISNLLLLCQTHHALVHSSKVVYKPLLLATLWFQYVEGLWMSVPETAQALGRLGLLSDLQQERLAG
jgi:5-methylcytosine-specific restriction endonuclease McrA